MYNEIVLDLFQNASNFGVMDGPHITGQSGVPGEGPFVRIHIRTFNKIIEEASFETYGCPAAIACGSWTAGWIVGKTAEEAMKLDASDLLLLLGGLPLGKEHCATLAIEALRAGVAQIAD